MKVVADGNASHDAQRTDTGKKVARQYLRGSK